MALRFAPHDSSLLRALLFTECFSGFFQLKIDRSFDETL